MFIVLEGTDGSGKHTQTELLTRALENRHPRMLSFPCYESKSSDLVKMYLNGEFGENANSVSAYAASMFYAVDRYVSYLQDWGEYHRNGELLIADRYVTSNMIYQTAKLPESEQDAYLNWLYDFEYHKLKLPEPDMVLYLDVPSKISLVLRKKRGNPSDIHEKDLNYLEQCNIMGQKVAEKYHWTVIECADGEAMRTVEDIHQNILRTVLEYIRE